MKATTMKMFESYEEKVKMSKVKEISQGTLFFICHIIIWYAHFVFRLAFFLSHSLDFVIWPLMTMMMMMVVEVEVHLCYVMSGAHFKSLARVFIYLPLMFHFPDLKKTMKCLYIHSTHKENMQTLP